MPPLRILVADDHDVVRTGLRTLLESRNGWKVCAEAANGRDAVEKARDFKPDVAVLDIAMPKLSGYEAARIIREQPWGKHMFLVALSGWGHHVDHQRSKEAGFDAHLTKPAKYEKLMEVLNLLAANEQTELLRDREL